MSIVAERTHERPVTGAHSLVADTPGLLAPGILTAGIPVQGCKAGSPLGAVHTCVDS